MIAKWEDSHQAGFALTKGLRSKRQLSISLRWPIYLINSVDKSKILCFTSLPTQHPLAFQMDYTWVFYSAWCTGNTGIQQ